MHDSDESAMLNHLGQSIDALLMQPNGFDYAGGKLPTLCKAFSGDGMVDADDFPLMFGDVGQGSFGALDDACEALWQSCVECDFTDVVE